MRIDRIHVEGFGRLSGFDTGPEPLEGLVVVLGPNEAGKSTLFAFLTTALYGFQPATREGNQHVPWGSAEASGRVRLRLDAGDCADVERKLRSQPSARMTHRGVATELRNQAVPWVEHIPRAVFRQVFAITLGELAGLDEETWARIQDKVVGSMGASDLRPSRAVADALEREAGEIWRPNRRGHQRLRELQAQGRALRARRQAAQDRDQKMRAYLDEGDAVRARVEAVRAARNRDRDAIQLVQTLLPVKRQLDRIASLRADGGNPALLAGLPDDPPARLAALESERADAQARRDGLAAELAEQESEIAQLDVRARTLLDRREDIARVVARAAGCAPDRAQARRIDTEIRDLEARLDAAGARVLDGSWRGQADSLAKVRVDVLRDRLEHGTPAPRSGPRRGPVTAALVAGGLMGAALFASGVTTERTLVAALGAALLAVAVAAWLARLPERAGRPRVEAIPPLGGVRVRDGRLTESLVTDLARLQHLLHERAERTRALASARARVSEVDTEALLVGADLGLEGAVDADAVAASLEAELRHAERLREAADQAQRDARRLLRERQTADASLASLADAIAALRRAGSAFSGADPTRGLVLARDRLAAHRRADQLEEELTRSHPDLEELTRRLAADGASETPPLDADGLAQARARIETGDEEIERLLRRGQALESEAQHLREMETVDAVDSEIATLRESETRLARERDRKWLLARVIREADRRFREEHQPDLLRRAGSYLAHLTGGRYERLVVDETDAGHLFRLVGPGLPAPVALAAPVSTGTLEQAYLSLRLAIVDHLDRGAERLPLFVDEVFVNWDGERRARGIEVLASMTATRQVFVFTCHASVAEELARRGGRVLTLGRSG